ncbi:MAG TPA: FAD-binding and (Fe-S)-binding domain-containing protein [Ktedonobacterales bacterium]|nr:FAD-binding and (Fe-S)-binding domain-containing protein [Ktedonobacterales bacterium]
MAEAMGRTGLPSYKRRGKQALANGETRELEAALRRAIAGEVRFDDGARALYATDASNYRQPPIGVVIPRTTDDVLATVAICRAHGAPLLSRGGGTSLAGQCCNAAVVLDFSKYLNKVLEIDPERKLARVQPGVVLDHLRAEAERHHLTFGPDPATHNRCTLGGMLGNDSCGVHSVMAGKTVDNTHSLDVVTYDGLRLTVGQTDDGELERIIAEGGRRGDIYARLRGLRDRYGDLVRARFPNIPRRVSGYNLDQLLPENGFNVARALVGTEGTCVTLLEATLNLVHSPSHRVLLVLGYPDIYSACDHVMELMEHKPIGLEGFDEHLVSDMRRKSMNPANLKLLPSGRGWLIVEFGADSQHEAQSMARNAMEAIGRGQQPPDMRLVEDPMHMAMIWKVRESGLGATARLSGTTQTWPGWEDSAAPPEKFADYLRDLRALIDSFQYTSAFYGHFGQGCLHTRVDFDLTTSKGIARFRSFIEEATDLVVSYGGSPSGEHGDGQSRAELLPKVFGQELVQGFGEFKAIWDPDNKMNPGKVVAPYRIDENLRLGSDYRPAQPKTHFRFQEDDGSLATATLRCVGVGLCRRHEGGTMCPSYMVTREEMHSTRGRAHLLFEMLQGDVLNDGWRNESVREALDLCLACKGCKGDCPVNVDMATYKAEFLSHYYEGRLRPRSAYSMGLIHWWARVAALAPALANTLTHAPGISRVARAVAGVSQQRSMPAFAPQTFKSWWRHRPTHSDTAATQRVLLWPDTFNNHFHPETAAAAVEVLEAAGFAVDVPRGSLCCGRPLYDFGMLDTAKRLLRQILDALAPELASGTPIVVLEPSCAAVFRDELINLFPDDKNAHRLKAQTYLLSEFLEQFAPDFQTPVLPHKAVMQGHCHQKALMGMHTEEAVLRKHVAACETLDSGCCGMAGAFGFEADHYDVSIACGERVLLPTVRNAPKDTLIVADGFSCREQIEQTTDRRALHLAEVLQMGLHEQAGAEPTAYPERGIKPLARSANRWLPLLATAFGVGLATAIAALWRRWQP